MSTHVYMTSLASVLLETGARIDSQEMQIARLAKKIDALAHDVEEDHDYEYNRVVSELERRLEHIEGT